jgi:putative transcriptional regulator
MNDNYMNDELFEELLESVREGGAILRGEKQSARWFEIESPDVKAIRARFDLSQSEFAALLGVSVKTLQNWEQGRRTPHGAARILLEVAAQHPEAVWDVVQKETAPGVRSATL